MTETCFVNTFKDDSTYLKIGLSDLILLFVCDFYRYFYFDIVIFVCCVFNGTKDGR